jgi:hypothetical protein
MNTLPIEMFDRPRRTFIETRSRNTDGQASRDAAKAAASCEANCQRTTITATVKASSAGLTAREVGLLAGLPYYTVQRRISECGLTKTSERRDRCAVWSAV